MSSIEEFHNYFYQAMLSEFIQYTEVLSQVDNVDNLLDLINPYYIRQIISNSSINAINIVEQMLGNIDKKYLVKDFNLFKIRQELKRSLELNTKNIDAKLNSYDSKFRNCISSIIKYKQDFQKKAFESSFTGATVGSVFGPFGSFLGGMLGGATAYSPLQEQTEQEFKLLLMEYQSILNDTQRCLNQSFEESWLFLLSQFKEVENNNSKNLLEADRSANKKPGFWKRLFGS